MLAELEASRVEYAVNLEPAPLTGIEPVPPEALFGGAPRTERNAGGPDGLRQLPAFSPDELAHIRALVHDHLVNNAAAFDPKAGDAMAGAPLEDYHHVAGQYPHAQMLSKRGRIMTAEAVDEIRGMSLFDYMAQALGADFELSDEEGVGYGQVCLRIVRPHTRDDVGSLHRDSWFWTHYDWPVPAGRGRLKVWAPVIVDPMRAGLLLAKGSHLIDAPWHTDTTGAGKFVFVPEFDPAAIGLERYAGPAGSPVMFNYDTLHCGTRNRGSACRVSIEITFLFKVQA